MKVKSKEFAKSKKNVYNPNSYSYLDAGIAFMVFTFYMVLVVALFKFVIRQSDSFYNYMKKDYYFASFISIIISQIAVILFALIYARIRKVSLFSGGGYAFKWNFLDISMACILAFGVFFVLEKTHMFIAERFSFIYGETTTEQKGSLVWLFLTAFILTPFLPAFFEEAFMRGIIARSMEKFGVIFAIIVSGFAFGIFHANPQQLFLQSVSGMAMALVYFATKNFVVPIAMHFFHNLFSTLNMVALETVKETNLYNYYWAEVLVIFLGVICCIVGLIYFIKKLKKQTGQNKNISIKKKVYTLDTVNNVITEGYAFKVEEYTQRLSNGELFLKGNSFISANKLKNKIAGFVLICISLVIGLVDVFIGFYNILQFVL